MDILLDDVLDALGVNKEVSDSKKAVENIKGFTGSSTDLNRSNDLDTKLTAADTAYMTEGKTPPSLMSTYGSAKAWDLRNVNDPHAIDIPNDGLTLTLRTPTWDIDTEITGGLTRLYILFAGAGQAKVRISKMGFIKV